MYLNTIGRIAGAIPMTLVLLIVQSLIVMFVSAALIEKKESAGIHPDRATGGALKYGVFFVVTWAGAFFYDWVTALFAVPASLLLLGSFVRVMTEVTRPHE